MQDGSKENATTNHDARGPVRGEAQGVGDAPRQRRAEGNATVNIDEMSELIDRITPKRAANADCRPLHEEVAELLHQVASMADALAMATAAINQTYVTEFHILQNAALRKSRAVMLALGIRDAQDLGRLKNEIERLNPSAALADNLE
jgi:hypothetical protein